MAKKKEYDESEGVWRTIGGRRVFIKKGQSLSDAMKESGKFKKTSDVKRGEYQDLEKELKANKTEYLVRQDAKEQGAYTGDISDLKGKHIADKQDKFYTRKDGTREYDPYKGTRFEKKYDSMEDVIKDPNSALNKYISEKEAKDELKEISGGAVSTLQTTTPKSKADRLKPGTEIYYTGDQANIPGYFTVEKFEPEKEQFLASVTLKEKGGEGRTFKIGSQSIASEYGKDPGARFSFKEDYDNYRNKIFEGYRKQAEERKAKEKLDENSYLKTLEKHNLNDSDPEFKRSMLGRMESDIKYYTGNGGGYSGHLWAKDENEHINIMKALYNTLPEKEKPDWINESKIDEYSKQMDFIKNNKSIKQRYSTMYDYLKNNTLMSESEIIKYLKELEKNKK